MRLHRSLPRCAALCALLAGWGHCQDPAPEPPEFEFPPGFEEEEAHLPAPAPVEDESTPEFRKALELQKSGKWAAAQKALRAVLDRWPSSVHARDIELRAGDNALLGVEVLHKSGPSERRIDVAVMGDGFTIDAPDQALQGKWARLCLDVLFSEAVFDEYRDYFNYYFVRLASLEEGVDPQLSPEERERIIQRNKTRTRKKKIDYSTALDCKAAGPQGQVMADPRLVRKWMRVADALEPGLDDDRLTIAFARFGVLGMGGGGIANVGRPDKSVTVHEFGHAFVGLLDEYAVNPFPPQGPFREAPNAATTDDPRQVPWAHFLERKVPGVGVFEGGATHKKGVWRPARSCAMNSAGATGYCPVCREAAVLRIYRYVSPIESHAPSGRDGIRLVEGSPDALTVTVKKPRSRALDVTFFVENLPDDFVPAAPAEPDSGPSETQSRLLERLLELRGAGGGRRDREDREAYALPPPGRAMGSSSPKKLAHGVEHAFLPGRLRPGRYRITAVARDTTPWVLKDDRRLLEERVTWWVTVRPR